MPQNLKSPQKASLALTKEYPAVIPYQIEFASNTAGRHIGFTKRRIRFKFGFAHIASVMEGKSGPECRGIEMEVQLVWSVTGGKFAVFFNLQQMHQSVNKGMTSKVDHTFVVPEGVFPGGHLIHISGQQMGASQEGHKFNLKFNGQSFFDFLKLYELGGPIMHRRYGEILRKVRMQMDQGLITFPSREETSTQIVLHEDSQTTVDELVKGRAKYIPGSRSKGPKTMQEEEEHARSMLPKSKYEEQMMLQEAKKMSVSEAYKPSHSPISNNNGVATTAEEERQMMAQARLASLRDLRMKNDQSAGGNHTNNLQTVSEQNSNDLLDFGAPTPNTTRPELYRSTSSITNEFDDDNTTMYPHLDPRQSTQTQQNMGLSFKLQSQPPTYADSTMGDILSSHSVAAPSTTTNFNQSIHGSFSASYPALAPTNAPFGAPPPPTWDDVNNNFAAPPQFAVPNNQGFAAQSSPQNNYNPQQQYSQQTAPNSNNFAAPPPLPTRNW